MAFLSEAASFLRVTTTSEALRLDAVSRQLLFTDAHTIKRFNSTPVSDEELTEIWDLAKWPPTMANTQPLRVLFVRTPSGFERLLPHLTEKNQLQSASAPVTAVLALDTDFHEHAPVLAPQNPQLKDFLGSDDAMRQGVGTFSAALQAGYFILAVRAVGLHAGPMGGFDRDGIDKEFFPDGRFKSVLVVNIGHEAAENSRYDRQARLPHDESLRWA